MLTIFALKTCEFIKVNVDYRTVLWELFLAKIEHSGRNFLLFDEREFLSIWNKGVTLFHRLIRWMMRYCWWRLILKSNSFSFILWSFLRSLQILKIINQMSLWRNIITWLTEFDRSIKRPWFTQRLFYMLFIHYLDFWMRFIAWR